MRAGSRDAQQALSRQGRYQTVRDNLKVKEVGVGEGDAAQAFHLVCCGARHRARKSAPKLSVPRVGDEIKTAIVEAAKSVGAS